MTFPRVLGQQLVSVIEADQSFQIAQCVITATCETELDHGVFAVEAIGWMTAGGDRRARCAS